ncbi:MAG: radical SAM protein [Candidatus Rifleibacteriota bacterium]
MNNASNCKIRVSYGTGIVLGLIKARQDVAPTTAYLLWDKGCIGSCSFCPRANGNQKDKKLSRIIWPEFEFHQVINLLDQTPRPFKRVCLQTGFNPAKETELFEVAMSIINHGFITSITLSPSQTPLALRLLDAGADHIGIGLDAASAKSYSKHKRKNWNKDWPSLMKLVKAAAGKIEVHLIYGLGDTEETFCTKIEEIVKAGGKISLFALTPLNSGVQPPIDEYRRVQIFRYLCEQHHVSIDKFNFKNGKLFGTAFSDEELLKMLDEGNCFRTSGCGNCNRPYYNEKPGQKFYNFPRELTPQEFDQALKESQIL